MTDRTLSTEVMEAFLAKDPHASGAIAIKRDGSTVTVSGNICSTLKVGEELTSIILTLIPGANPSVMVSSISPGLVVALDDGENKTSVTNISDEDALLDEVTVLYQGEMPIGALTPKTTYKRENWNTFRKVEACVAVAGFIAPIVVDSTFTIIDGDLRYSIAKSLGRQTVPVIVINDAGIKADFLRLALNRSAEFQRWKYDEVDAYLDSVPVALPLLEPLGFFGERILPESFFGQTVLDYEIHEDFKSQQNFYKQEYGLAKWAELQRERIKAENEAKHAKKVKKPTPDTASLFDLNATVKEDDFLEVHDVNEARQKHVDMMREVQGTITENYDTKRKAEKEAKGQAWQTTRRAPKKVIEDLKAGTLIEDSFDDELGVETE